MGKQNSGLTELVKPLFLRYYSRSIIQKEPDSDAESYFDAIP
jgi:hypothetical protein